MWLQCIILQQHPGRLPPPESLYVYVHINSCSEPWVQHANRYLLVVSKLAGAQACIVLCRTQLGELAGYKPGCPAAATSKVLVGCIAV